MSKKNISRTYGFREASKQLNDMSKASAKGVGRRALKTPARILADTMIKNVKVLTGATRDKIAVEKEKNKKGRPQIAVASRDIASIQLEFGNSNSAAQPFARPSKEEAQERMFNEFGSALKNEVDSTVIKLAAKSAKAAKAD